MIKRIFYTTKQAWCHRKQLRGVRSSSEIFAPADVCAKNLQEQGYQTIVFDFDGILAPHGETKPIEPMQAILQQCLQCFGQNHVYILSNKPSQKRLIYFQQHFPGITFIAGQRKKPYPDGLQKIIALSHTPPEKVLLIDDRLLTGILAALTAQVSTLYVNQPLVNVQNHPIIEGFFQCLRFLERRIF